MPRIQKRKMYRKKRVSRKKSGKISKSFVAKVKKVIHRQAENKVWLAYGANNSISTASSTTPTNLQLVPNVSQGTGHANRIGDEITVQKAFVKGFVNLLPYNSVSNPTVGPLYVKMWLFSVKNMTNSAALSTSTVSSNFFEAGTSSTGFQGNMLDMILTENQQLVTIYKTKIVLLETGATQGSTYYNSAGASCGGNGRFSAPFYFSYAKHMKRLKYDDTSPAQPTNRNLWLAFQAVYADGTSLALTPAEYHYSIRVEFEDL